MAKTKKPAKKQGAAPAPAEPQTLLDPKAVHELLRLPGPYDPPPPPIATKGYATIWDPGCSIHKLRELRRDLFYPLCGQPHNGYSVVEFVMWRPVAIPKCWPPVPRSDAT